MSPDPKPDFIDIEKIIQSKNANLLRFMPGFLLRYIKRIIHQEHINDFIRRHGDKESFSFVDEIIIEFGPTVSFEGLENIPAEGGAVVASNHPLGGLDAMALLQAIGSKRRDLKFIVNDVLLSLRNFADIFVGVNKHGRNATDTLEMIDDLYNSDNLMLIFPAGLVSRKQQGGIIRDLEWKKSFIVKAKKFNRAVIPVHIEGNNSAFFYNLARLREKAGIKSNIEMFYLMDEMYHQKGKHIHIIIGKPILPQTFTAEFTDHQWAQKVKDHVYSLQKGKVEQALA